MPKKYPREDLIRMSTVIRADTNDDGMMTLFGVPIVFDEWTEINSWEGRFKERISPTAVDKTISERGDKVKVLFNHGMDPQIGEKPLGKLSSMEIKSDGLHIEAPLVDTSYNRDLQALLEAGALDGMSFRFGVISDEWDNLEGDMPERTITELRLYEVGPVTFAAYEATTVGVRSRQEYDDYRKRQQSLTQQFTPPVNTDTEEVFKSDPDPDVRSADDDADQGPSVAQKVARLIREVDMRLKGVTE